jgi:putative ABC transport system substrate-binding protein
VIVALGNQAIQAAQLATTSIAIVGMADDLVKSNLAASMAHPGSNTTGVSILASELDVKRLELLYQAIPDAKRIGVIVDPTTIPTRPQLEKAADELKVKLIMVTARNSEEVAHGLDALKSTHVDGVNVLASPILYVWFPLINERLNGARLPAIYQWPEQAEMGGLFAYGPRVQLCQEHLVGLVDKILRGTRPQDLPIEQPSKFDFVVNLKTAKAIGLTVPPSLLARADEVIE